MAEKAVIIEGPSREELFDALRLRDECRQVTFTVVNRDGRENKLSTWVNGISAESGSGHCWELRLCDPKSSLGGGYFRAFLDTKTRQGWLRPENSSK